VSKDLLRDPGAAAVALMPAARALLGDFLAWEPESIWLELQHQGVDVPIENRAKIMTGVTLHLMPAMYWDGIVLEKTALSLDGIQPNPDILEEATPAQLAWAVVECDWIIRTSSNATWEWGSEPRAYVGVILARAGFVLAPEPLAFAQLALNRERFAGHLLDEVKTRWAGVDKNGLDKLTLQETPVDVQIARLAAVALHVRDRRARAERDLTRTA
jgi:hypothetical protein